MTKEETSTIKEDVDTILAKYPTIGEKINAVNEIVVEVGKIRTAELERGTVKQLFNELNIKRDEWLAAGIPDSLIELALGKFRNRHYQK